MNTTEQFFNSSHPCQHATTQEQLQNIIDSAVAAAMAKADDSGMDDRRDVFIDVRGERDGRLYLDVVVKCTVTASPDDTP